MIVNFVPHNDYVLSWDLPAAISNQVRSQVRYISPIFLKPVMQVLAAVFSGIYTAF